jgi:hypothetical protein
MKLLERTKRFGSFWALIIGVGIFLGACAPTYNYTYDPKGDFLTGKNYTWESKMVSYRQDLLIEKNIRYYTDQSLKDKGFTLNPDKPDFVIMTNYETEYFDPYKLRVLNLYVYKTQSKEIIWQGSARGLLKADADSSDLANAVKKILTNFPPVR